MSFYRIPDISALCPDLSEILLDIADDSPETAERIRAELYTGLQALGKTPGIGHYHDDYAWEAKPIQVIAVVHGARSRAAFFGTRLSTD